jgi:hypothetical protein
VCVCLCVFVSYRAMRTCYIVFCGLSRSTIFFHISHTRHNFRKNLLNTKCVFWFSLHLFCEIFPISRRSEWDLIKDVYWSSCKLPVTLVRFETSVFSIVFRKIMKHRNSWKHDRWEPMCSVRTDGQKWRRKLSLFEIFRTRLKTKHKLLSDTRL